MTEDPYREESTVREFATAAAGTKDPGDWIEWDIIERDAAGVVVHRQHCKAVREPGDGQVAFLMSRSAKHVSNADKVVAFLNFFDSVLDDETQSYVSNRLLDPRDPFGLEEVQDLIADLMEEWSGRPTESLRGSTPSQQSTGLSSTPPPPPPTSSVSP